jgi:hypothetical protein
MREFQLPLKWWMVVLNYVGLSLRFNTAREVEIQNTKPRPEVVQYGTL